ncbi:MAG: translocation/assembly module TamB domain-containing protein [Candidatus Saganbacteria bacterium]|nr:translocation/assembly module TamB domain-containing protein [Candidatus Saganbacteria bacterium]
MIKKICCGCIIFLLTFSCAQSIPFFNIENPIFSNIKEEISKQASAMMGREISVGSVDEILLDSITLNDVRIAKFKKLSQGSVITIKRAKVHYNVIRVLAVKDIISAIGKIEVFEPKVYLEHEKDGSWNLAKLLDPGGGGAPPPPFKGKIFIRNGTVDFRDLSGFGPEHLKQPFVSKIANVTGTADLSKKDKIFFAVSCLSDGAPIRSEGKINLKTSRARIKLTAAGLKANPWIKYLAIPAVKATDLNGKTAVSLDIQTLPKMFIKGSVSISDGNIYGRPFSGKIDISFDEKRLVLGSDNGTFCGGTTTGNLAVLFAVKTPLINGEVNFSKADLKKLSGGLAGTKGLASGNVLINGAGENVNLTAEASLSDASLAGQNADRITGTAVFERGCVTFDRVEIFNGQSKVVSSGRIEKDLSFYARASASRFSVSNPYFLDGVRGTLDYFEGNISGRIDDSLFKRPFQNINFDAQMKISDARISMQDITSAEAQASLKKGAFELKKFILFAGDSKIEASGALARGTASSIMIRAKNANVADFKIIDKFAPSERGSNKGLLDVNVAIKGVPDKGTTPLEILQGLDVSCEMELKDAILSGEEVKTAKASFQLKEKKLEIKNITLTNSDSNISISGKAGLDDKADINLSGNIDLARLRPLTQRFARINGCAVFNGNISGKFSHPLALLNFRVKDLVFNEIKLDRLDGTIKYKDKFISVEGPVIISQGADRYSVSAELDLNGKEPSYSGQIYTNRGGLSTAVQISSMVYSEALRMIGSADKAPIKVAIRKDDISFPDLSGYRSQKGDVLFTPDNAFLKAWTKSVKPSAEQQRALDISKLKISGLLGANIFVKGRGADVEVKGSVRIINGLLGQYDFDSLDVSGSYKSGKIYLNGLSLKDHGGNLDASGMIDVKGPIDLNVSAKDLPAEKIETATGLSFPIDGRLTVKASANGKYFDPNINAVFSISKTTVGGFYVESLYSKARYSGGMLDIEELDIRNGKQKASIKGRMPFVSGKNIDIKIDLAGDNAGLLVTLFKGVSWTSGGGQVDLDLSGTIDKPLINGSVVINDAVVNIDQIRSTLYDFDADIKIVDSYMTIKRFSGTISGDRTLKKSDVFSIAGDIDLADLIGKKQIWLNIAAAPVTGSVGIPGFYSGQADLRRLSLKGTLSMDGSLSKRQKAVLSADLNIHDGKVIIPQGKQNDAAPFVDIGFDVDLNIGKSVYLVQGESNRPISLDMSNINLEVASENLELKGFLSSPTIIGDVDIKSGTVNILGRDFNILSEDKQEQYFSLNRSMIMKNTAIFSGGSGLTSALPYLSITAQSEVKVKEKVAQSTPPASGIDSGVPQEYTQQKVYVLTRATGIPSDKEKARPLNIQFFAFKEDASKTPPMVSTTYDQNKIREIILPDFVRDTLNLSNTGGVMDTNAILVDYLNSSINSYLVKSITGNVEKALGLESFTLDYNFGRDLEKYLPTRRGEYGYTDKPQLAVGIAKGFFDKIFIQLKYAQSTQQNTVYNNSSFNYQISWKIDRYYSLAYYREPMPYIKDWSVTYYKLMLQYAYVF